MIKNLKNYWISDIHMGLSIIILDNALIWSNGPLILYSRDKFIEKYLGDFGAIDACNTLGFHSSHQTILLFPFLAYWKIKYQITIFPSNWKLPWWLYLGRATAHIYTTFVIYLFITFTKRDVVVPHQEWGNSWCSLF